MSLAKCACIDTIYTELPWTQRFQAAKDDGFAAVEFWDWRIRDEHETKAAAKDAGIPIVACNADKDISMIDPAHRAEYLDCIKASVDAANRFGIQSLTLHSNALGKGGVVLHPLDDVSDTVKLCTMYDTLAKCAKIAEDGGVTLNLEALNGIVNHPGVFLKTTQMAAEVCELIGSPRLKILYDVYHMQISEGSICNTVSTYHTYFSHVHIADAPGRHEPGTGEIHYKHVVSHLEACGYTGMIGYELFPASDTKTAVKGIMEYS